MRENENATETIKNVILISERGIAMSGAKNKESKIVVIAAAVKIAIYCVFLLGYSVCLAAQMLLEGNFSNSNKFKDPAA